MAAKLQGGSPLEVVSRGIGVNALFKQKVYSVFCALLHAI
jgi:hypothetical protein